MTGDRVRSPWFFIGLLLLAVVTGCGESPDEGAGADDSSPKARTVKREGQPDYVRAKDNDKDLERAIARAKATYMQLVNALADPKPTFRAFSVKKPFATPDGGEEHIWISEIRWDGKRFQGKISNEPVDTKLVKLGDKVEVTPEELTDWMYVDGKTIVGGFTVRVLHYERSAEERKAAEEQMGLIVPPVDF